jgi:hypothetical protein
LVILLLFKIRLVPKCFVCFLCFVIHKSLKPSFKLIPKTFFISYRLPRVERVGNSFLSSISKKRTVCRKSATSQSEISIARNTRAISVFVQWIYNITIILEAVLLFVSNNYLQSSLLKWVTFIFIILISLNAIIASKINTARFSKLLSLSKTPDSAPSTKKVSFLKSFSNSCTGN